MTFFALNLALAVIWMLMSGDVSFDNLLIGLGAGFVVVAFHQRLLGSRSYLDGLMALVILVCVWAKQLWLASWQLAGDILRVHPRFDPVIVTYETADLHPTEIAILSNLISLTPGSLTVDADTKSGKMLVHSLYGSDVEEVKAGIRTYVRLIRAVRGASNERRGS